MINLCFILYQWSQKHFELTRHLQHMQLIHVQNFLLFLLEQTVVDQSE